MLVVDQLRILVWQQTKDGQKGRRRPKPISPLAKQAGNRYGGKHGKSNEEVKAYLARFGPPPS
jgi:hypothetical protein